MSKLIVEVVVNNESGMELCRYEVNPGEISTSLSLLLMKEQLELYPGDTINIVESIID